MSQNYGAAIKWYKLAAEQDNANAQYNLGTMYDIGQGVPQDHTLAYKWWNLAASQGNERAKIELEKAEQRTSLVQIDQAQRLVRV